MNNRFLIKYLGTHGGEVYPPAVQELATTAVLRAIKSPVSSFSDRNALLEVGRIPSRATSYYIMSCHRALCRTVESRVILCRVIVCHISTYYCVLCHIAYCSVLFCLEQSTLSDTY